MKEDQFNLDKLVDFFKKYSFDDLAKSFFVLNLWLPNIASPIKIQFLYVVLESISAELPQKNLISQYSDFKKFIENLLPLLPQFPMLEDYVPESDWGEIKYYFEEESYKIFYGGDLSNPYDFYYAFEIIHLCFKDIYENILKRSPDQELHFCLHAQDYILKHLNQAKTKLQISVSPGDISLPSEEFWSESVDFLEKYQPDRVHSNRILNLYTIELIKSIPIPTIDTFLDNAYKGCNCPYFFIKNNNRYYPIMPRKWLTIIYDSWGKLLENNYQSIKKELKKIDPPLKMTIWLSKFIRQRFKEEKTFSLGAPLRENNKALDLIFTIIQESDKIFLIGVLPPIFSSFELSQYLKDLSIKIKEGKELLMKAPTRLGLLLENKIVEFRSKVEGTPLKPFFIFGLPSPLSYNEGVVEIPDGIDAKIMTLDQLCGLLDEIEDLEELSSFFQYLENEEKLSRLSGINSYLDLYGSFKDSHGMLVPGAVEPDRIMLDFSWGSNFRYKNLKKFWKIFPENGLFGHPRGWEIIKDKDDETSLGYVLSSKTFFGFAYYQRVGNCTIFINSPVNLMTFEVGQIANSMMHSLFDAINLYSAVIEELMITKDKNKLHILLFPSSLVNNNEELSHLKHLLQNEELWAMDIARLGYNDFGVRVVYDDEKILSALRTVKDRSLQMKLLIDVLTQYSSIIPDPNFSEIIGKLSEEQAKQPRFKFFSIEKKVSFPQRILVIFPDPKDYKLADKEIAKIALSLGIKPGNYSKEEARQKLNELRSKIVGFLNEKIRMFSLDSLFFVIEKFNALINKDWYDKEIAKASLEHEVDYDRGLKSAEDEKKFLHWYRVFRYITEKIVHLQPSGKKTLGEASLKEILALADRLLDIYVASDFINYEVYPVTVEIDEDYLVSTRDGVNMAAMDKEYGEEQARLNIGIIGNLGDYAKSRLNLENYLKKVDIAFKSDFGFSFKNLVNVLQVLANWANYAGQEENTYYYSSQEKIGNVCSNIIEDYSPEETGNILEFLTLEPSKMLSIVGDPNLAEDLPVWEHNKRTMRYDIRPLIKIADKYYWGPYSADRTAHIWAGITDKHKLPSEIVADVIPRVLKEGHLDLEEALVDKIKEIVLRHTKFVKTNLYPHDYDRGLQNIGDCDVFAYIENKNIILNIESKIIDPPHSNKDSGRMQRKIFGQTKSDGSFKGGYLQKVEKRGEYLKNKGKNLVSKLAWPIPPSNPKIISIFATRIGFWWTKNLPIKTEVNFIETRLLDDFIKNL